MSLATQPPQINRFRIGSLVFLMVLMFVNSSVIQAQNTNSGSTNTNESATQGQQAGAIPIGDTDAYTDTNPDPYAIE